MILPYFVFILACQKALQCPRAIENVTYTQINLMDRSISLNINQSPYYHYIIKLIGFSQNLRIIDQPLVSKSYFLKDASTLSWYRLHLVLQG